MREDFLHTLKTIILKISLKIIPAFLAICLIVVISACNQEQSEVEISLDKKLKFNYADYQRSIKNIISSSNYSMLATDSVIQNYDTLKHFYTQRNYQPVFVGSFEQKKFVFFLLNILDKADEHGLNPEEYHTKFITEQFLSATADSLVNPNRFDQLAETEILIADAILKYSFHIRYGVVNPKEVFNVSYNLPVIDSKKKNLFEPLSQTDIIKYLNDIQPKSDKYVKLQNGLKRFENLKNVEWAIIPKIDGKIELGDNHFSLVKVYEKLIILGFIDTSKVRIADSTYYDSLLVAPLKKFQRLNGLNDDGVIGNATIEKFNVTPQEYIEKIKISLERFRWIDYSDIPKYVLVNIPDFKLYVIDNKKKLFDIRVCTGIRRSANYDERFKYYKKTRKLYHKPDDWETPAFYGEISYMVLNPTWNVPASIIREEILREVKKDSNYLQIKNFKVYKDEVEIDLRDVDINKFSSANIPYRIVQDPGAGNALGKIKFMFNNPFGIYLHDTPSRAPFGKSNRAVSHGCVRVEKPIQFAEYILQDHPKWNIDYLKIEIGQRVEDRAKISEYYQKRSSLRRYASLGKTTDVILTKKIPLVIDYYTAWVDENGDVNFRDDVYRKDKLLKEYLFPEKNSF